MNVYSLNIARQKEIYEMEFIEISKQYAKLFNNIVNIEEFEDVKNHYERIYIELIQYIDNGYKLKIIEQLLINNLLNYLRIIVYGWFLEKLIFITLQKNKLIKTITFTGDDSKHDFFINELSQIEIYGAKTTEPDFLIEFQNGKKLLMELKSAAREIFTIKKGNVEQLSKSAAFNEIPTSIIMIDIVNNTYEIKNLEYFIHLQPFVNHRMEGQLCYDFPRPTKNLVELLTDELNKFCEIDIFGFEIVKKYMILAKVEKYNLKKYKQIVKNKISLEKLDDEFLFAKDDYEQKILKIKEKYPEVSKTWLELNDEIEELLKDN